MVGCIRSRKIGKIHRLWFSSVKVKTFDVTMRRDELVADVVENIGLKLQFSSRFFESIYFYIDYIDIIYQKDSIYKCVIIESNVLHRSVFY